MDLWLLRTNRDGGRVRSTLLGEGSVDVQRSMGAPGNTWRPIVKDTFFDRQILIPQQLDLDDDLWHRHYKTLSNALREPFGTILG